MRATVLNRIRVNVKDDKIIRINKLISGKQIYGKSRNLSNIRNIIRSGKSVSINDRKGSIISGEDMNMRIK